MYASANIHKTVAFIALTPKAPALGLVFCPDVYQEHGPGYRCTKERCFYVFIWKLHNVLLCLKCASPFAYLNGEALLV